MMTDDAVHTELLRLAARKLKGHDRRVFVAQVAVQLCDGKERLTEERFGWSRETVRKGIEEIESGQVIDSQHGNCGRRRIEEQDPKFAQDVRDIAEPQTQADPELKSERRYLNLSAAEVRTALMDDKGWKDDELPSERSLRRILNRMGYRLKKIQKGRPLKKTQDTDAIFANVKAVKAASRADSHTLEISGDTKAKVAIGDYSRGGKNTDRV